MSNEDDLFKEILDEEVISNEDKGGFTVGMKNAARQMAPWMKFLAIMLFIFGGFTLLTLLYSMTTFYFNFGYNVLVQLVIGGVYIFMGSVLFKAGSGLGLFAESGSARKLEDAMEDQLKFWKTSGILTIIGIGLTILSVLFIAGYGFLR